MLTQDIFCSSKIDVFISRFFLRNMWSYILEKYPDGIDDQPWDFAKLSKVVGWDYIVSHLYLPWNAEYLSRNSSISWEFVSSHIEGINETSWDFQAFTYNKNLCWRFVELHRSMFLDMTGLSLRNDLCWELVEEYPEGFTIGWDMLELSANPSLPWDLVEKYPEGINGHQWQIDGFSSNPSLTLSFVQKYYDGYKGQDWNVDVLSENIGLDWKIVEKYPKGLCGKSWNMEKLSRNRNIPWKFIEANPKGFCGIPWDIRGICYNPSISWDYIETHPRGFNGKFWDGESLSANENLPMSFLLNHPEIEWCMIGLSLNSSAVSWDFIRQNPKGVHGKYWTHYLLMRDFVDFDLIRDKFFEHLAELIPFSATCVCWDFVKENRNFPWDMSQLSKSKSLNWEFVEQNIGMLEK